MALEVMAQGASPIPLDVSFHVEPGVLLALVGHSGSGKTTVLRTIAGLWRPESARVVVDGTVWTDTQADIHLPPHRRRVGLVFQSYALFPHMTATENVASAMDRDQPRARRRGEAERLLELVNLPGLGDRYPARLSGGQQQRVALARALARQPRALLLDEPFSAVDRPTRERLYAEIVTLRAHLGMPVVLVTHDVNEAQMLADRMVVIEHGRVLGAGTTAEVMSDPAALRGMGIREVAAMLTARVAEHEADGMSRLDTATGPLFLPWVEATVGTAVRVRIMAHDVMLSRTRPDGLSAQNILPATVIDVRPGDGPGAMVRLGVGNEEIVARITRRAAESLALAPGMPVHAILKSMSVARDHVGRAPNRPAA